MKSKSDADGKGKPMKLYPSQEPDQAPTNSPIGFQVLFVLLLVALAVLLVSCNKAPRPTADSLTPKEAPKKFYYDLGPDAVDVARYPKKIRKESLPFQAVCSGCHTPARPLN